MRPGERWRCADGDEVVLIAPVDEFRWTVRLERCVCPGRRDPGVETRWDIDLVERLEAA